MPTADRTPLTGSLVFAAVVLGLDAVAAFLSTGPIAAAVLVAAADEQAVWFTFATGAAMWVVAGLLTLTAPVAATLVVAVRSRTARVAACALAALVLVIAAAAAGFLIPQLGAPARFTLGLTGLLNLVVVWVLIGTFRPGPVPVGPATEH